MSESPSAAVPRWPSTRIDMKTFLLCALLFLSGCATPLPQTPPAGIPASIVAPEVRVGDSRTYQLHDGYTRIAKGTYRYTVTAIEPQRMSVQVTRDGQPAGTQVFTRDWNWIEKPMTNLQNFRYSPPYPALPFPLEAGKSWQAYVQATDPATGKSNRVRIDGEVLGWERVKVPAGEFDALKVRRVVYAGNEDYDRGEEHIREIDWYAPLLGQSVKQVSSSEYLDKRASCDDGYCDDWVRNDWNVMELVSAVRGVATEPR
jgi:hypothetical protein